MKRPSAPSYLAARPSLAALAPGALRRALGGSPDPSALAAAARQSRYEGGRFRNTLGLHRPSLPDASLFAELRHGVRLPRQELPVERPSVHEFAQRGECAVRWLGHSCTWVELEGVRLLTDPVFQDHIGPAAGLGGAPRFHPCPVPLEWLGTADAVVLSHDHYDHLDVDAVTALARHGVRFIVPLGVGAHLVSWGIERARITELDWWDSTKVGDVEVMALPSAHFSGRSLDDRNRTLWASFAFLGRRRRVFFSGDTGTHEGFRTFGERLGRFDVAMFEVGAFHPTWSHVHLGPDLAVQAAAALGTEVFFPIHWGTYPLALHDWWDPAERVAAHGAAGAARVVLPRPGERVDADGRLPVDPWWRPFVV